MWYCCICLKKTKFENDSYYSRTSFLNNKKVIFDTNKNAYEIY